MKLQQAFATSEKAEIEGVWIDIGEGGSIKVARAGNPDNRRVIKRLMAPHKQALRTDRLPDDIIEKLTIQAMAETILLDWKGIEDAGGAPIPYSREAAARMLGELKDFRDYVAAISGEMKNFQSESLEAAAKN